MAACHIDNCVMCVVEEFTESVDRLQCKHKEGSYVPVYGGGPRCVRCDTPIIR